MPDICSLCGKPIRPMNVAMVEANPSWPEGPRYRMVEPRVVIHYGVAHYRTEVFCFHCMMRAAGEVFASGKRYSEKLKDGGE